MSASPHCLQKFSAVGEKPLRACSRLQLSVVYHGSPFRRGVESIQLVALRLRRLKAPYGSMNDHNASTFRWLELTSPKPKAFHICYTWMANGMFNERSLHWNRSPACARNLPQKLSLGFFFLHFGTVNDRFSRGGQKRGSGAVQHTHTVDHPSSG